ncbi:MAG: holo-ACP synthase [Chloroflexi bacterium]|nr:holo-ACP synthase [Chloroflexota bacterium]
MLSSGIDLIELARMERALSHARERFLQRVYTPAEQAYCRDRLEELAVRFAGKEAISKALGTGIMGISWVEMEILPDAHGKPQVILHGRALARAQELGLTEWSISLSHSDHYAVAMVVAAGSSAFR